MSGRPRLTKSRRSFLKALPTAIATGAAATSGSAAPALPIDQSVQAPDVVTSDALGVAQELVGLGLPPAERESARPLVVRNRENYELIRRVNIPSETEPAFSFRPPRPNGNGSTRANGVRSTATPLPTRAHLRARPASLEDVAFESIATLASLIASRRVSSTELTDDVSRTAEAARPDAALRRHADRRPCDRTGGRRRPRDSRGTLSRSTAWHPLRHQGSCLPPKAC